MKGITEEWIQKAEQDFVVATRELSLDPPVYDAVCFHSQQCIEKYLKALLQENNCEFQKLHDLEVLGKQCLKVVPELKDQRDDLVRLSVYAVDVRYPGFDITEKEAKECVRITIHVRKIIREYFNLA